MLNRDALKEKFQEAGLKISRLQSQPRLFDGRPDFVARADIDGREIELIIEVKERPHLVDLRLAAEAMRQYAAPGRIPMVAAHFMGPNRRALLREMGIGYIDMAGNMYLRAPGVLMEREGKPNPSGYAREELNPYSDKASIVLRVLMDEPGRKRRIREIAKAGDINPGWVSRVVERLVERGLIEFNRQSGVVLLRGEDMLKEWADVYDWRRNKFYYYYCHALDFRGVMERVARLDLGKDRIMALGFQAGAYLVSPYASFDQVHVLIDGASFDSIRPDIERQLGLESRREGANLILVRPYYKHSALFGVRKVEKWWVVSDVQLYLDLNKYPLRGREQAEHLLEKVLRPRFEKATRGAHGKR
jgi:hypothetical protein